MSRASMESYFDDFVKAIINLIHKDEHFTCSFSAEQSDFVRFNHARIRQAGNVEQAYATVELVRGSRHARITMTLTRHLGTDQEHLKQAIAELRASLEDLNDDPLFVLKSDVTSSRSVQNNGASATANMVDALLGQSTDVDMVGFLANGPQQRGFANSFGQRNWHEVASFNLEWSLYHQADKAVKSAYAGFTWNDEALRQRMARARRDLAIIARPAKKLKPGGFRVFVAPAAMSEVVAMMGWGGFSEKARRTRQSPLQKLAEGQQTLNPMVSMAENTGEGLAPTFQMEGYIRPSRVDLISQGKAAAQLVSPRTAREYSIQQNGADVNEEMPQSIDFAGGSLPTERVLAELGTGLYLNNLWYLNFSDRMNCRLTGMTRFASLWVENGEIVAPCDVMRFDDSVYRMLGSNLMALTQERDFIPDSGTYLERMTVSQRLPGALIDDFRLTL